MGKKDRINLLVVIAVASLMIFLLNYRGGERRFVALVSIDSLTTIGKVTSVKRPYKHGIAVTYVFEVKGIKYYSEVESSRYAPVESNLISKTFPVIFKKSNPAINYILIMEDDYKMFGRQPPFKSF